MVIGRLLVIAIQDFGIALKEAKLVVVDILRTPGVDTACAYLPAIILKEPFYAIAPYLMGEQTPFISIADAITYGIRLFQEVTFLVIAIARNTDFLVKPIFGVRSIDGKDTSLVVVFKAKFALCGIDNFLKPALCCIAQAYAKAIAITDAFQEMNLIIAHLGKVVVKVFVDLIERIASIALNTKLYTFLDIKRSFCLLRMT